MKLDCRGLDCPVPVLRTKEVLESMEEGILDVELDSFSSIENVKRFVAREGFYYEEKRLGSRHVILSIVKGYECAIETSQSVESEDNHVTIEGDSHDVAEALRAAQVARSVQEAKRNRTFWTLMVGGVVSAILASTCCLGPLLFLLFGVSVGSLGFLQAFAPYHGWFSTAAGALVAYLWLDWWRGRRERIVCGTALCRNYTLYLSLGTLFVALLASYPWWMGYLLMED